MVIIKNLVTSAICFVLSINAVLGKCSYKFYWTENHREETLIKCSNTSVEDYTYEVYKLDIWNQSNFITLSISNSSFSHIKYLVNPIKTNPKNISILSLNYCSIKTIARDAFKDFGHLEEINVGFNYIDDLKFLSYLPPSVKKLNLTNNNIKEINFGLLANILDTLDLSFNQITHVALSSVVAYWWFPVKKHLYLNNNNIIKVEFHSGFRSNKLEINLAYNKLKLFKYNELSNPINLKLLNLSQAITNLTILNVSQEYMTSDMLIFANNPILYLDGNLEFSYCQFIDFSNCSLTGISSTIFQENKFSTLNFSNNNLNLLTNSLFARSDIQTLDFSRNRIQNIKSVFQYANIGYLNLSRNKIEELNAQSLQKLEYIYHLDLGFNKLKLNDKSFVNCKGLVALNLAFSEISEMKEKAFFGLSDLKLLNLEGNMLKVLQNNIFKPLIAIEEINLSNNKLTSIQSYLFNALALKSLDLSMNNLEAIETRSFHNLSSIQNININKNNKKLLIRNNAFSHMPEIKEICIKNSKLSEINLNMFSEVPALNILDVRNNEIELIDFSNYTEYLNLTELHVTLKGYLKPKMFLKLVALKKIRFWNSTIKNIEPKTFQGLFNLEVLDFIDSTIEQLNEGSLDGLFNIKNLDAKDIFKKKIRLESNMFRDLHSIESVDLSYVHLESISSFAFVGLRRLINLDLSNNKLNVIENTTFSGLEKLKHLDLSCNNFTYLARDYFKGLENLKSLNLSSNKINDMDLGALQSFPLLESLYLSKNNLTQFEVGAFSNLCWLKILDLQQNSISSILFESFLPLKGLEYLNLENNNLKSISNISMIAQHKFLKWIGLGQNKWQCENLAKILVTLRNYEIDYSSTNVNFYNENIEGIRCIDICKYLLCLKDSHGIN